VDPVIIDVVPTDRKTQWKITAEKIRSNYPSIDSLKWDKVFDLDPVVAGRIINDIIKIGGPSTGKPGKRPSLDEGEASKRYRQIIGEDYSERPFTETFKAMCGNRSIRHVAATTELDRNMVYKLLRGAEPTVAQMESIAEGFKKAPSFFLEYRIYYVTSWLFDVLVKYPESSIVFYTKLVEGVK